MDNRNIVAPIILIVLVGGWLLSYQTYKTPPSILPKPLPNSPVPGQIGGSALVRGLCITWFFPFIGREIYAGVADSRSVEQCQAFWTGEAHGWDWRPAITGWIGTLAVAIFLLRGTIKFLINVRNK